MPNHKVLIVEDEPIIAMLLGRIVEGTGASVELAYNGEEALTKIRQGKPDLMLLDLIMPVKSGEEVLQELAADPELKDLPVIIITTKDRAVGLEQRSLLFLQKPFDPSEVKRLVREALGASESAQT